MRRVCSHKINPVDKVRFISDASMTSIVNKAMEQVPQHTESSEGADILDPCHESKQHANRKFYEFSRKHIPTSKTSPKTKQKSAPELFSYVENNIVGRNYIFSGPFGNRKVLYCDYTASGKSLQFIEDYINKEVLPVYGNTHTTTSVTSIQTTLFRHEARDIIRNSVNASEYDSVIFSGSGATGAIHKLIHGLKLSKLSKPVVFVGPYEHHSNLLPWREIGSLVITINETSEGLIDVMHLDHCLQKHKDSGHQLIGCFSAASNVTGILSSVDEVTSLLHQYGALVFWDYASAAPYVKIDMNPVITGENQALAYKDAIFLSPHKFVGGVGSPGLLVAKKALFRNPVPSECGGGTVFFVSRESHRYLQDNEMREEGGTPDIIGSIRAGLVFQLKEALTAEAIMQREEILCRKAIEFWKNVAEIKLLGSTNVPRLPTFSFLIHHPPSGLFLHHNFVAAVLNDVFGIQCRGGCACAGPYALNLLGIDEELAQQIEDALIEDDSLDRVHLRRKNEGSARETLRPGFVRLNLAYFMSDDAVEFVLKAVKMVSKHAWKLLPQYIMNPETGEWKYHTNQVLKDRKWLGSISYASGRFSYPEPSKHGNQKSQQNYGECLSQAEKIFAKAEQISRKRKLGDQRKMYDEKFEKLRWFLLPSEASEYFGGKDGVRMHPPFQPKVYKSFECVTNGDEVASQDEDPIATYEEYTEMLANLTNVTNLVQQLHEKIDATVGANIDCNKSSVDEMHQGFADIHNIIKNEMSRMKVKMNDGSESSAIPNGGGDVVKSHQKKLWHYPSKSILKPTLKAINEFEMIKDKDRLLVCLSGGKDSLSLLHTMKQYQYIASKQNINFELGAVTVDPQTESYRPESLKVYLAELGVPYFYEEQSIMDQAASLREQCTSICSFCSRMKRGRIYACARRNAYNVLALGQHLDDLTESFFMSVFHNGRLRTMKANYTVKEGDLRVIRPFVYVRESNLRNFAVEKRLPVISENCPACFEAPTERHRMKQLLASHEVLFPKLYASIRTAIHPLMSINRTGLEGEEWIEKVVNRQNLERDDEID